MAQLEWDDVQGFVRRGMGWLTESAYVLLNIQDPDKARLWINELAITSGADVDGSKDVTEAVNLAFTFLGLCELGFDKSRPAGFPHEFVDGMAPTPAEGDKISRRSGMLGDVGVNDPKDWNWGGYATEPVHILLMVFRKSEAEARALSLIGNESTTGVKMIAALPGRMPEEQREHFGFRDGLSQPSIVGDTRRQVTGPTAGLHQIAPGEILIGYRNERDNLPVSPQAPNGSDFGQNGSYLVLRELEQNVKAFEDWLDYAAREKRNGDKENYREWIAAKVVGRWRNGAPLTRFPENDSFSEDFGEFDKENAAQTNDFFYHTEDREGFRCPVGSHIRRAWPRDTLGSDPDRALKQARLHRILRRGRIYGPRYNTMNPEDPVNEKSRGILFACFNADIAGQFEAVQHNWINNPKFSGLTEERDPLIGEYQPGSTMTIQSSPLNLRPPDLEPFVVVRGGAYFFVPGLQALQHLTQNWAI